MQFIPAKRTGIHGPATLQKPGKSSYRENTIIRIERAARASLRLRKILGRGKKWGGRKAKKAQSPVMRGYSRKRSSGRWAGPRLKHDHPHICEILLCEQRVRRS